MVFLSKLSLFLGENKQEGRKRFEYLLYSLAKLIAERGRVLYYAYW